MSRTMLVPLTSVVPNIDLLLVNLFKARTYDEFRQIVTADVVYYLCQEMRTRLMSEPVLLPLTTEKRIVVIGDLHGQYFDLIRHFQVNGLPPTTIYLFLGDYVDRGKYSVEVLCLLYALKVKYPDCVYIVRGDHECSRVNRRGGFYSECLRDFSSLYPWNAFVSTFNVMPFAAIIDGKILCIHGGLSPLLEQIGQLKKIERPVDIPHEGLLRDIVWSDFFEEQEGYGDNERRETSFVFGKEQLDLFLKKNNLVGIIRGHELVNTGFLVEGNCITVFSACQYVGCFDNSSAAVIVEKGLKISFSVCYSL
ncbi:serine/threonine protein phosphatase PP1-2, putative [Entamoeba invadens IP1]|uniref:serine/threonine protein phosphatase PP1-2, putative n=1 Tax=Entamoeba invadens IP1 TaxID=370355 RepID=UPI0002C3E87A|nr:serine/threonine protein phosphatase PP1-2, putative [Entamoeba invadens IP1]ELP90427.1 serine/threonine protein phosphatase PP1-2, putative [Entamoeba invadens IP1]|eukprot:XP_004257198.1 serine/threonine protein phosphatase PP1-2, putative [Entamoeba invadens IP1]